MRNTNPFNRPRGNTCITKNPIIKYLITAKISLLANFLFVIVAFYVGTVFGTSLGVSSSASGSAFQKSNPINLNFKNEDGSNNCVTKEALEARILSEKLKWEQNGNQNSKIHSKNELLSQGLKSAISGMARTSAVDFHSTFDYGYPISDRSDSEVLVLYVNSNAVPNKNKTNENKISFLSVEEATSKCEAMSVVTVDASEGKNTCLVVSHGYESFHLQRWMRNGDKSKGDVSTEVMGSKYPLRHVSRGMKRNGADDFHPPKMVDIQKHWGPLKRYLETYEEVTEELKPILERIAIKNTVIVMVCNMGQASLLMNFACSAKSRGFNLKNVLVFATDKETLDMAEGLGLSAFYDDKNFGDMPTEEAKRYGDRKFVAMMYAKVVCVQLVNMLGYDVLFQDVDIVWYKNPLDEFHDTSSELADFDVLFQDDGARSLRYAPYSANSGFYYVRHNDRTRYLFTSLLYSSDLIASLHSHQQVLTAFITEHSSLFGTKVKTLNGKAYPGGYHYHRDKKLMQNIVTGDYTPALFHMSWTNNKDNKLLFFKQMGLWYLKEQCEVYENIPTGGMLDCCSVEPLVSCHYRDKPSVIPCKDSPPIDSGQRSFW